MKAIEIIEVFTAYIQRHDANCRHWYFGIAEDPRTRLFTDHRVREDKDPWIFEWADEPLVARQVRDYFHHLGAEVGPEIEGEEIKAVYAYLKFEHTNP